MSKKKKPITQNHVDLTDEAITFLEGHLLGDGALEQVSKTSARYKHSCKYREYLSWIATILRQFGVEDRPIYRQRHVMNRGKVVYSYYLNSRSYPELLPLYHKWYSPELGRQPPDDLVLKPTSLQLWFMDDGTYTRVKGPRGGGHDVGIGNFCFAQEKQELLLSQLHALGLIARQVKTGFSISRASVPRFFSIIGPCPVPCYRYKWPKEELGTQLDLF